MAARIAPALLLCATYTSAQDLPNLSDLTEDDIGQAAIAFVNLTGVPGLSGATFRVNDSGVRESDLIRSSLGFGADFTLKNPVFNGYWGLALGAGQLDDTLFVEDDQGNPLQIDVRRRLVSLRGSLGTVFPVHQNLKIRTYGSLLLAHFDTNSSLNLNAPNAPSRLPALLAGSSADSITLAGTGEVAYDRFFDRDRLELIGRYSAAYTDTYEASNAALDTEGWNHTLILTARYSNDLTLTTAGRPWRWNTYLNHVRFMDQPKIYLGFDRYTEVGLGIDYEWNLKPLNWFGLRNVGFKIGYIKGDNVEGASIGLTF